jgi:ribosomal protein S20
MPTAPNGPRPKTTSSAQLAALREDAARTLQEMEEAIVRTRSQLKIMETLMRRVRKMIESGRSATEVAGVANAAQARAATSDIIREVQAARHRAQQAQFKLAAAEGSTMAEIARGWGVSRQLVSRMVKEPSPRRKKT